MVSDTHSKHGNIIVPNGDIIMFFIPALFFALFTVGSFTMNQAPTPEVKAEEIELEQ